MYAKQHILIHSIVLGIVIALFSSTTIFNGLKARNDLMIFGMFIALFFFLISAILPDSDSDDVGSKIFYTPFFIIGLIHRALEYPLKKITKRERGHRESLHTIFGAFITSIFWSLLIWIFFLIFNAPLKINWFILWFSSLFFGQILHFIEDWHWEWI